MKKKIAQAKPSDSGAKGNGVPPESIPEPPVIEPDGQSAVKGGKNVS